MYPNHSNPREIIVFEPLRNTLPKTTATLGWFSRHWAKWPIKITCTSASNCVACSIHISGTQKYFLDFCLLLGFWTINRQRWTLRSFGQNVQNVGCDRIRIDFPLGIVTSVPLNCRTKIFSSNRECHSLRFWFDANCPYLKRAFSQKTQSC